MFNVKAIREQIADLESKALAISTLVQEEGREPSAEEVAELDRIQGHGDSKGLVGKLSADLDRAIKLEEITKRRAKERHVAPGLSGDSQRIEVPSYRGRVKNFTGPDAEKNAYLTGQYFNAVLFGNEGSKEWLSEHGYTIKNAHSQGDNTKGGYLVPEVTENTIIRLVEEYGVFRRNMTRIWPVTGSSRVPKRAGGFTVYHPGENEAITESDLALSDVELVPHKAAVLTKISNELTEGALPILGDLLVQEFAYALALDEDQAAFNGDGTLSSNKVIGLKNALLAGSKYSAANGAGKTSVGGITLNEWSASMGVVKQYLGMRPKWYIHSQAYYDSMHKLQAAAGGNTMETLANGAQMRMFLGYPVEFAQVLPNITTANAATIYAYFGDLSYAAEMGEGRGLTVASDSSYFFNQDALAVRCTERYDIKIHDVGTATAGGAVVAILTAAST